MDMELAKNISARRAEACFLCKWIQEDLRINGKLTDYPYDYNDHGDFPVYGKIRHLELEQASLDNLRSRSV